MKIKDGYLLREVSGNWVVLALGDETLNFNGMMTLNASGRLLWQTLEQGADQESLTKVLTDHYEVSQEEARVDVDAFLAKLQMIGCIL